MQPDEFFSSVESRQLGSSDLPQYDGRPLPSARKKTCGGQQHVVEGSGYEPPRVHLDDDLRFILENN